MIRAALRSIFPTNTDFMWHGIMWFILLVMHYLDYLPHSQVSAFGLMLDNAISDIPLAYPVLLAYVWVFNDTFRAENMRYVARRHWAEVTAFVLFFAGVVALNNYLFFAIGGALQSEWFGRLVIAAEENDSLLWLRNISEFITSTLILILLDTWLTDRAAKKRLEAEMNILNWQIGQHFLSNTLNNLFILSRKDPELYRTANEDLIRFLEYSIYSTKDGVRSRVTLEREVEFIRSYIALKDLAFEQGEVQVVFDEQIDDGSTQVMPLLLIDFIENAFRHGIAFVPPDRRYIHIKIQLHERQFYFEVRNAYAPPIINGILDTNSGVGIQNLERRLQLNYDNEFEINTGIELLQTDDYDDPEGQEYVASIRIYQV